MRLTNKQKAEIDYLSTFNIMRGGPPTDQEIEEYINHTVHGKKKDGTGLIWSQEQNRLFLAKRNLDMTVKQWRRDLRDGLFVWWEFLDGDNVYVQGLVDSIIKGIDFTQAQIKTPEFVMVNAIRKHDLTNHNAPSG